MRPGCPLYGGFIVLVFKTKSRTFRPDLSTIIGLCMSMSYILDQRLKIYTFISALRFNSFITENVFVFN